MKKKILLTAGVAAAMTVGMAMTSLAGWEEHGGNWYYYTDANHEMVKDEWAVSGQFKYYLGHDGKMVTNSMIDDTYYVDQNGAMTVNGWQWIEEDRDEEGAWRYFGANGKIYTDGMKLINGVYYHFEDSKMSTGWIEEDGSTYYFNADGSRTSGWKWLTEKEEDSWNEYWYYFSTAGRLTTSTVKAINGIDYAFDSEGRMLTGWVNIDNFTSSSMENLNGTDINDLRYVDENGAPAEGWMLLDSPSDTEPSYYYFKKGKAYSTTFRGQMVDGCEYGIVKIDSDYYCFDEDGKLVTGIVTCSAGPMYFDPTYGKMLTGRVTVYDDEYYGEKFFFKESGGIGIRGIGVSGIYDGYLYQYGQPVCAAEGMKYSLESYNGNYYIVNESGKIKTSGTATDADGNKWKITKVSKDVYKIEDVTK